MSFIPLFSFCLSLERAQPSVVVGRYLLASSKGTQSLATIRFQSTSPDSAPVCGVYTVSFVRREKGKTQTIDHEIGEGFTQNTMIRAGDYIRAGRKQVCLTIRYNRFYSCVLDFDGQSVRKIYESPMRDVVVEPIYLKKRGWRMKESFPATVYEAEVGLGVGRYDHRTNGVFRYLHWNGKEFVEDRPGATRILGKPSPRSRWKKALWEPSSWAINPSTLQAT